MADLGQIPPVGLREPLSKALECFVKRTGHAFRRVLRLEQHLNSAGHDGGTESAGERPNIVLEGHRGSHGRRETGL
jgi:hypothetical protein